MSDPLYGGPVGDPGPPLQPVAVVQPVPGWLKALATLLAILWSIGAIGGIWYIAHRIDATCDLEYAKIAGDPDTYQVLCSE
jgi:hypothetical protein